jgi:hypothetical protein
MIRKLFSNLPANSFENDEFYPIWFFKGQKPNSRMFFSYESETCYDEMFLFCEGLADLDGDGGFDQDAYHRARAMFSFPKLGIAFRDEILEPASGVYEANAQEYIERLARVARRASLHAERMSIIKAAKQSTSKKQTKRGI